MLGYGAGFIQRSHADIKSQMKQGAVTNPGVIVFNGGRAFFIPLHPAVDILGEKLYQKGAVFNGFCRLQASKTRAAMVLYCREIYCEYAGKRCQNRLFFNCA
jgi:hypothetical protein